ncbi:uncharacterized protein [Diabrotica undecimpunctata]|uniref:uncharacterized protein n=1 Tax=Diabrotica undecimpunctata TaxID=50387 RepID=UPI003B63204D
MVQPTASKPPKIWTSEPPKFEGRETEIPTQFLTKIEDFLTRHEVDQDDWVDYLTTNSLHGEARSWAESQCTTEIGYQTFKTRFLEKFDNPTLLAALTVKLYGQIQRNEPAEEFVTRKAALFKRLLPDIPEDQRCRVIANQLIPQIRICLRLGMPKTEDSLRIIAREMEADAQHMGRPDRQNNQHPPRRSETIRDWQNRNPQNRQTNNRQQQSEQPENSNRGTN